MWRRIVETKREAEIVKIERFEDMKAWQKAPDLTREIYTVTNDGVFFKRFHFHQI